MYGYEFEDIKLEVSWHGISTAFRYSGQQAMKLTTVGHSGKQAMKLTTLGQVKLYNYISTRSLRVPASD